MLTLTLLPLSFASSTILCDEASTEQLCERSISSCFSWLNITI